MKKTGLFLFLQCFKRTEISVHSIKKALDLRMKDEHFGNNN